MAIKYGKLVKRVTCYKIFKANFEFELDLDILK